MTEDREYNLTSSFFRTSSVEDIEIFLSPNELTRKVLRAELVDNSTNNDHGVRMCLVHQKRRTADDSWEDESGTSLVQTTFNQPSKFPLDSAETYAVFDVLCDLYRISKDGITRGRETVHVTNPLEWVHTDADRAEAIKSLLEQDHGVEMWKMLVGLHPNLADRLAASRIIQERQKVLDEFESSLEEDHLEQYWQDLLKKNTWIFGGSNISLLSEFRIDIQHQTDLPFKVAGGFMDIVELKKPSFPFWVMTRSGGTWKYRDKFLVANHELSAAIAQTRHYILQAEKHVTDSDFQRTHEVVPLKPRGLVVHGRSNEWEAEHWEAWRLLNDGMHGIQVITFDHLLEQGRRFLALAEEQNDSQAA